MNGSEANNCFSHTYINRKLNEWMMRASLFLVKLAMVLDDIILQLRMRGRVLIWRYVSRNAWMRSGFLSGLTRLPTLSKKNSKLKSLSSSMIMLWRITQAVMMLMRLFLSRKWARPRKMANLACKAPKALSIFFRHASCAFVNSAYFFVLGSWMVFKNVSQDEYIP
jgi:hypothetical protein